MPELLLELFSEEIPARMQARAAAELCSGLHKALAPLMAQPPRGYVGPRRLTAVGEMAARAETAGKEERGPRIGAPDAAIEGFLRKHGAARDALTQEGQFWVLAKPGAVMAARDLIAQALPGLLRGFPWPKSMRWGDSDFAWVRPLHRILCVFDGEAVRIPLGAHGLVADALTEGHRIMSGTAPFAVRSFAEYERGLRERFVLLDAAERERIIADGVARLAAAEGLEVVPGRGLLAEVAGLVEWPVPLLGRIDDAFMDLPPEVLRTTMRVNQRYFSFCHPDGRAASRFAVVANIAAEDGGAAIVAGNERVLRARLADARFFWDQDRKQRLEDFLPKLEGVVFHAKLGTQGDRVRRLERLALMIAEKIGADSALVARAAKLAKADLATGMVGEFPELQGVVGGYYAKHEGQDQQVSGAIEAHYRPLGPDDRVPRGDVAVIVGLADKLDQIVGLFATNELPTGSGDPYALRRAALGIIRTVIENDATLPLSDAIGASFDLFPASTERPMPQDWARAVSAQFLRSPRASEAGEPGSAGVRRRAFVIQTRDFIFARLKAMLRASGASAGTFDAGYRPAIDDDLLTVVRRVAALSAMLAGEDGRALLAGYRRAANIVRDEETKDGTTFLPRADRALLRAPEEIDLADALDATEPAVHDALARDDFTAAMAALAALRPRIDTFFDRVTVNDPDRELRRNRLALLSRLRAAMDRIADLSKIEG